jgi:hypothetical protein
MSGICSIGGPLGDWHVWQIRLLYTEKWTGELSSGGGYPSLNKWAGDLPAKAGDPAYERLRADGFLYVVTGSRCNNETVGDFFLLWETVGIFFL